MAQTDQLNYTREAFMHPLNLGALLMATLASFFLNDIGIAASAILTLAFGLELIYLGTVPQLPRFRRHAKIRKLKEMKREPDDKEMFGELSPTNQKRFLVLKHLTKVIRQNFDKLPYTSQGMLESINKKIDGLMTNYIKILDVEQRYRELVQTDAEKQLKDKIRSEALELEATTSETLKEIKNRRMNILNKRLERFVSAKEKIEICHSQLETIEDAVRYIYEQSMTMRNPEELGLQLDTLLLEVEETASDMRDIDDNQLPHYTLTDLDNELEKAEALAAKTGNRVKN